MIIHDSKEYNIISIMENSFSNSQIESIDFSSDSTLQTIGKSAFYKSSIQCLTIPSQVSRLKNEWCKGAYNLINIKLSPDNPIFKTIENGKIIIGKSDIIYGEFDWLNFCCRDIETVTIPNYIEDIGPFAFESCIDLSKVEFQMNSKLDTIFQYAFYFADIEYIKIPSEVREIERYAFCFCRKLRHVEFQDNSKLSIIFENAFSETSLESIVIPQSVVLIKNDAFSYCEKLQIIEVSENSQLRSINIYMMLGSKNVVVMVPQNLEYLSVY